MPDSSKHQVLDSITLVWCCFMPISCSASGNVPASSRLPEATATQIPTPAIPYWGSTATAKEATLPLDLTCDFVTTVAPGPEWNGLQIGVSTYQDVFSSLPGAEVVWRTRTGSASFRNPDGIFARWTLVKACFVKDKLSALKISGSDIEKSVPDWVEDYGDPDWITWGGDYYERSLIWAEAGLLAVIDLFDDSSEQLILFAPIPRCGLKTSWLSEAIMREQIGGPGDVAPPPNAGKENPWGIKQGLDTCP